MHGKGAKLVVWTRWWWYLYIVSFSSCTLISVDRRAAAANVSPCLHVDISSPDVVFLFAQFCTRPQSLNSTSLMLSSLSLSYPHPSHPALQS